VAPFALQVARLKSPFGGHGSLPLIPSRRRGNYVIGMGKSSTAGGANLACSRDGFATF
jgi:hypothetical protein